MKSWKKIVTYCRRDLALEWQDKSVISSSMIYLVAVVFIALHAFELMEPDVWNALFWIVLLFSILTVVGRSFEHESGNQFPYHYHLVEPQTIIFAKLLVNGLYSLALAFVAFAVFSVFLGNQIQSITAFMLILFFGASGIGFTLTLTSCLSARAGGNLVLTSILSLPIILPLLIIVVQLTEACFSENSLSSLGINLLILVLLNGIIISLSSILFPYLWRD